MEAEDVAVAVVAVTVAVVARSAVTAHAHHSPCNLNRVGNSRTRSLDHHHHRRRPTRMWGCLYTGRCSILVVEMVEVTE